MLASLAHLPPQPPSRVVQLLSLFVDTASAQAAVPELEAVPGVRWVRVVKPQAMLRSVAAHEAYGDPDALHVDVPGYVAKVALLARAERAGVLVDCDGADPDAVTRALCAADALVAFTACPSGVRELPLRVAAHHRLFDAPEPLKRAA